MLNLTKITENAEQTYLLGQELARYLPKNTCVLFSGSLGAGKTQFIKGLASFYGIQSQDVQSPTYALHHSYYGSCAVHHFDLYRISGSEEFLSRGFYDIIQTSDPIFIEWPTKIDSFLFSNKKLITVDIKILDETKREIKICYEEN